MTRLTSIRRHAPVQACEICDAEATTVTTSHAMEIFARCAPVVSGTSKNGCRTQSQVLYNSLAQLLERVGAKLSDVVIERAFFRDVTADFDDFQEVRSEAYRKRGITGDLLPATTYVGQPPCRPGQDIELQAYAVVPVAGGSLRVRSLSPSREHVTIKLVEAGPARHLYIGNVTGQGLNGAPLGSPRQQSDKMFENALEVLSDHGIAFPDVVRTWIHLDDIDRDYDDLNASRNDFFEREGVERLPASTGIGGFLHPRGTYCSVDVYALMNPEIAQIEIMHTPTLNEADEYGSSFSRGMKMALPEHTYLFISGTASVDEAGATAHEGDVRRQIERMLLNIDQLLHPHGATFADLVHAVTFLKSADYAGLYREICDGKGALDLPHTIVEADVCRPELLCEMEAIAVLPTQ